MSIKSMEERIADRTLALSAEFPGVEFILFPGGMQVTGSTKSLSEGARLSKLIQDIVEEEQLREADERLMEIVIKYPVTTTTVRKWYEVCHDVEICEACAKRVAQGVPVEDVNMALAHAIATSVVHTMFGDVLDDILGHKCKGPACNECGRFDEGGAE